MSTSHYHASPSGEVHDTGAFGSEVLHESVLAIIGRFLFGLVFGSAVALTLFWVLWRGISSQMDVGEFRNATRIEFSRMRKDTDVTSKRDVKPERERPPEQPDIPRMAFSAPGSVENNVVQLAPSVSAGSAMSKMSLSAGSDRDTIPLVRVAPEYPPQALLRGLEGWVLVRFTITGTGSVKDPTVVKSSGKIFEQPAIKAILRWRYNPRVMDGVAVESVGVQTIIRFELEQ